MWSGFGFDAGISYQMAVDSYRADEFGGNFDIDSGFSIYAGYTSPAVVFGPISVRAAYLYLNGQDNKHESNAVSSNAQKSSKALYHEEDNELEIVKMSGYLDNAKSIDGSLAWGTNGKGLYLATNYNYSKLTFIDSKVNSSIDGDLGNGNIEWKAKAWETVATYGFENGIRLGASYHYIKHEATVGGVEGKASGDTKFVQLIADYNVTPNFKVWAEGLIDAGSDDFYAKIQSATDGGYVTSDKKFVPTYRDGHNSIMFGARYVF